jgi:hypothetical protein
MKKKEDMTLRIGVGLFVLLVIAVFYVMGFMVEQPCGTIDKLYLWCNLHPLSVFDVFGVAMFTMGGLYISGISFFIWGEQDVKGAWPQIVAFLFAAIGLALIYI